MSADVEFKGTYYVHVAYLTKSPVVLKMVVHHNINGGVFYFNQRPKNKQTKKKCLNKSVWERLKKKVCFHREAYIHCKIHRTTSNQEGVDSWNPCCEFLILPPQEQQQISLLMCTPFSQILNLARELFGDGGNWRHKWWGVELKPRLSHTFNLMFISYLEICIIINNQACSIIGVSHSKSLLFHYTQHSVFICLICIFSF